ncbi:serine hydrolase domain-containing protein [Aquimarina sp. 2201CG5-10]|uniref:serine hydrolase domain-containing protein n=1 Tax=Aquimarina callyspongiae TaxID=3098150 RepID=UPI002AB52B1F|nr:serine hydrolase domain-containing protein [Aquimarina sp. 2201CG5-10]MDY8136834.1 serine hydrolase domain-containing protein [Aquimarina sp. 2201CG5-10]
MKKFLIVVTSPMLMIVLVLALIGAKHPESSQTIQPVQKQLAHFPQPPLSYKSDLDKELLEQEIQNYFRKAIQQNQIVGASIAIVKCDSIIYLGGYGNKNAALNDQITEETVFRIGSVSKGFAGILTGIHVEEGLIDWEDKIIDHIPNFRLASQAETKKVTLSHVLSHTSGLPYHSFTNLVEAGLPLTTIANRFNEVRPLQQAGTIYNYQNAIFALSGQIVEQVAGKPLKEVIKSKIFEPLQMNTASASYEALQESSNVALPHRRLYGKWKPQKINKKYFNAVAAGGVNASATDMAKWMKFLLGNNPDVMSSETMKEIFNPKIQVGGRRQYYQRWPGYSKSYYGLGWRVHNFLDKKSGESNKVIHHGGHVNSYRSEIAIFPENDLGICILFNSPTKLARTVIPDIKQIIENVTDIKKIDITEETQEMNYF